MTAASALPRDIGQAERGLGSLLEPLLSEAGLSFPEWTVLVFVDGTEPLSARELVDRQVAGRIASRKPAQAAVDRLRSAGLLAAAGDADRLTLTPAGEATFRPVRRAVSDITDALVADLPPADLDATHRTLTEVAPRAAARAAADA